MLGVSALMAPLCLPCFLGPRPKVASTTHSTGRVISTQHTHHAEEGVSNALEQSLIGLLLSSPAGLLCKVAKGRQRKSGGGSLNVPGLLLLLLLLTAFLLWIPL